MYLREGPGSLATHIQCTWTYVPQGRTWISCYTCIYNVHGHMYLMEGPGSLATHIQCTCMYLMEGPGYHVILRTSVFVTRVRQASHNGPITTGSSSPNDPSTAEQSGFMLSATNSGVLSHRAVTSMNTEALTYMYIGGGWWGGELCDGQFSYYILEMWTPLMRLFGQLLTRLSLSHYTPSGSKKPPTPSHISCTVQQLSMVTFYFKTTTTFISNIHTQFSRTDGFLCLASFHSLFSESKVW